MPNDFRLRVGVTRHPKIKRLVRLLGESAFRQWIRLIEFCAENRTSGSFDGMSTEDIELAVDFEGKPGAFAKALLRCQLLDRDEAGVLSLHDWTSNQPWLSNFAERSERARQAARSRWDAADDTRGVGHAAESGSKSSCAPDFGLHPNCDASGNAPSNSGIAASNTPNPSPLPSDSSAIPDSGSFPTPTSCRSPADVSIYLPDFLRFWDTFPRKDGKRKALEAWNRLSPEMREMATTDVPQRSAANWAGREVSKIPHAATYLNQRRWEDEIAPANAIAEPARPRLSKGMGELMDGYAEAVANEQARGNQSPGECEGVLVSPADRPSRAGAVV